MKSAGEFLTSYISMQKGNILYKEEIWYDIESIMKKYATQLLSDYTNKIIENTEIKNTGFIDEDGWVDSQEIDKESITNQLDAFLKDLL